MPKRTQARILFNMPELGLTEIVENAEGRSVPLRNAIKAAYKTFWRVYKKEKRAKVDPASTFKGKQ